ncbi:MAG: Maf family protein [Chloroflexi bacterium]|nr:Maf family protein [Chloroflexota bacterium]
MPKPNLLLASNSPRRRQLLELAGWAFTPSPSDVDEAVLPGELPGAYVLRLAESKARAAADQAPSGWFVLASDTTVVDGTEILGKPASAEEAVQMLRQLRGRTHQVYTALAVLPAPHVDLLTDLCITDVTMRLYSDLEIDSYVASGDPLDKAGAYGIQHAAFHPVERLHGCYPSVMGLPLCRLTHLFQQLGFTPGADVPPGCSNDPDSPCQYYRRFARTNP